MNIADTRRTLMTARDSRIGKASQPCLSNAIERLNRGDYHGCLDFVKAGALCDKDGGYIHEHHHAQPWSWVPVMPAAVRGARGVHQ